MKQVRYLFSPAFQVPESWTNRLPPVHLPRNDPPAVPVMRFPVRVPDTLSFTSRGVPFTVIFPTAVPLQFTERLPEAGLIPRPSG